MNLDRLITVREGMTDLIVPDPELYKLNGRLEPSLAPVFYNPKMQFSRDIAVLVLGVLSNARKRNLEVCDPLAASGARGIRFAKEVSGIGRVVTGDLNGEAIPLITRNSQLNHVDGIVEVNQKDACRLLEEHNEPGRRFDFIDIDPFGTPSPYLDPAVRALKSKGVLAITATDTAPLCGVYSKACFRKYGALPVKCEFCHEVGLRIMIGTAVREALKYNFGTEVLLSYSVDYYFRAYLRGTLGAKKGDASASEMGNIFYCPSCGWRGSSRLGEAWPCSCPLCGRSVKKAGPLWCGRLIEKDFVEKMLGNDRSYMGTGKRIEKLLNTLLLEYDKAPTYYVIDYIASRLRRDVPPLKEILEKLEHIGYSSSPTHFHPKALKTSAPLPVLTDIIAQAGRDV